MNTQRFQTKPIYCLGLEFGSTRIKSVISDKNGSPVAVGSFTWEDKFSDGYWTYSYDDIIFGMQQSFCAVKQDFESKTKTKLTTLSSIGISAMMHGYLPVNKEGVPLTPFRTWRNTYSSSSADILSKAFHFHIPARWSVAHLYAVALQKESHLPEIHKIHTLASYVHFLLTREEVIGYGDGSGMFPLKNKNYNQEYLEIFRKLFAQAGGVGNPETFFPTLLPVGAPAGKLTQEGARLLDISGDLMSGVPFCPPEGDAETGMVCTNSILPSTANISVGTSCFLMAVLPENSTLNDPSVDIVATPDGNPVAMVHEINCTSELNKWESLLEELVFCAGGKTDSVFEILFDASQNADAEVGNLTCYPFLSAEPIVGVTGSMLRFYREQDSKLSLANFAKAQLFSAVASVAIGVRRLYDRGITISTVHGHGGFSKIKNRHYKLCLPPFKRWYVPMPPRAKGAPTVCPFLPFIPYKKTLIYLPS